MSVERLESYQLTRQTSCAVRAADWVDVIWNVPAPAPGETTFGKFNAVVALKISALNSNLALPGSWNCLRT